MFCVAGSWWKVYSVPSTSRALCTKRVLDRPESWYLYFTDCQLYFWIQIYKHIVINSIVVFGSCWETRKQFTLILSWWNEINIFVVFLTTLYILISMFEIIRILCYLLLYKKELFLIFSHTLCCCCCFSQILPCWRW